LNLPPYASYANSSWGGPLIPPPAPSSELLLRVWSGSRLMAPHFRSLGRFDELQLVPNFGEYPVGSQNVKVRMLIERRSEPLRKRHRSQFRLTWRPRAAPPQPSFNLTDKDPQRLRGHSPVPLHKPTNPFGHCQYPLTHRYSGQHMVHKVGCGLGHAPCVTRGAYSPQLAGEGNQVPLPTIVASHPRKPVRQDPAFEVLPKSPLDVGWNRVVIGAGFTVCGQVALKMLLDQPVEHRLIGAARTINARCIFGDCAADIHPATQLQSCDPF
jgi:hypothetical protein